MDFSGMGLPMALGWPVFIILLVGLLSIAGSIGFAAWWLISHLAWV